MGRGSWRLRGGRGAVSALATQVLDMATTLGVSNNVIRMIERRQFWDKVLLYGGEDPGS